MATSARSLLADELEIRTFRDMLYYFPFRHIDRTRFYSISEFTGEMPMVQVRGKFISFDIEGEGARKRLVGLFSDGRRLMQCVWFSRVNALKDAYKPGVEYVLFGKPTQYRSDWNMAHPEVSQYNPADPPKGLRASTTSPRRCARRATRRNSCRISPATS